MELSIQYKEENGSSWNKAGVMRKVAANELDAMRMCLLL